MELKLDAGSAKKRGGDWVAMKNLHRVLILVISITLCFVFAACAGNGSDRQSEDDAGQSTSDTSNNAANNNDSNGADNTAEDPGVNILVTRGCGKCHDISPLGIKGNGTGPDLANAARDVEIRFGLTLEEFINEPQGTMHAVWGPNPLTEDEKQQIIETIRSYE